MTRASAHVRQIAWTCMFAVWLAIIAPVVTQLRAAMNVQQLSEEICSTQADTSSHSHDPAAHHGHADSTCGYCDLLSHHPPLYGAPSATPLLVLFSEGTRIEASATPVTQRRYVLAWSRDPPQVTS
ncbi:conserved hypothetical protein [Ricinus communis]|uniref:DUF2946 domain-containing protein n=1 Tax=Ricinus communis TaxID=3988 RepID=B9T8S5_RICCO|nr:conserved hypothetical protein [Ricinus communis]